MHFADRGSPLHGPSSAARSNLLFRRRNGIWRRETRFAATTFFTVCLGISSAIALGAQASAPSPVPAPRGAAAAAQAAASAVPAPVTDRLVFSTEAYCGSSSDKRSTCRMGDTLYVSFTNLKDWMAVGSNHLSDVVLVLNGRLLKGITPRGPDNSFGSVAFDLKRLDGDDPVAQANRETWNDLIAELRNNNTLEVAVASGGNPPFWGSTKLAFQVYPGYSWAVALLLAGLFIAFLVLARLSDIVRDAPTPPGGPKRSYSLARCQMAWWFFIVAASFCYVFLTLGNYESITNGVLILTGISAGTGLASVAIDSNKRDQRQSLSQEEAQLEGRLTELPAMVQAATGPALAALTTEFMQKASRLGDVKASLASLPSAVGSSEGFFYDILRDETGISFHRFQMVAWTLILSFVFISAVHRQLAMPDFSATLLGLMGISSGTYVGFKLPNPPK